MGALLQDLIARAGIVASTGGVPVVLLDLDSTLFQTAERHRRILIDFARARGDDALLAFAASTSSADYGWSVEGPLVAAGLDSPELCAELQAFWAPRFFSGTYAQLDLPTPGAVSFVHALADAGVLVVYLTGRTAPDMAEGTVTLLQRSGMPLFDGRTVLVMKPGDGVTDVAFKTQILTRLTRLGQVVATFENEPHHANGFREAFPDAVHVWLDTSHSPGAPPLHPDIRVMRDFTGA